VSAYHSLLNLPSYDPTSSDPLPIDRTVFTCARNQGLDDLRLMDYWDGRFTETLGKRFGGDDRSAVTW